MFNLKIFPAFHIIVTSLSDRYKVDDRGEELVWSAGDVRQLHHIEIDGGGRTWLYFGPDTSCYVYDVSFRLEKGIIQ